MSSDGITGFSGLTEPLSWQVEACGPGQLRVQLKGEINENADLTDLRRQMSGHVLLDLEGVTRINSCGVREWVNLMREIEVASLTFVRCSASVVMQLNAIYNFRGPARVQSFFAPYVCEVCCVDDYKLLEVGEHFSAGAAQAPTFRCSRCGGVMMFDELPERYLSFLGEGA
jgi:anti-anti-sigma regulatory factor